MAIKKVKGYVTPDKLEKHAELFANRVKKQYKHLKKRMNKANIDVFRLYDRDIPEVRAVVDWYKGHLVIGEYVREQTGPEYLPRLAQELSKVMEIPKEKIFLKKRTTTEARGEHYGKTGSEGERFVVQEGDLKFWVNLDGYLDTGLYADHRQTRLKAKEMAKGKDFLNLYAYTGAFSCAAAAGEAKSIVTMDRSATYIQWAKDNFTLNAINNDAYEFLCEDTEDGINILRKQKRTFNLAFVDPPSFSKGKAKNLDFDVSRDHVNLLKHVFTIMDRGATVIFSNNHQRFESQLDRLKVKNVTELTPKTIPEDYRNKQVHRCWEIMV